MSETQHDTGLESLLAYLRDHRGADFTGYKRPSLTRLINRRMQAAGITGYDAYADHLQVEPGELTALLDSLLINVTSFFRDEKTWNELRDELLPVLLAQLEPDEPIRVWSAACATGEEAYSLAILLHELLGDDDYKRRVKVYATDIDEAALAQARTGRFRGSDLEPLTELQRSTYFEADGDNWRFRNDLRSSLIFGRHDLLQDAPISRVCLLTCRNVLMYFTADTQTRVLERFPFALHEHGLLVLGKAEMLLTQSQLFTPVDLPLRVFRARRVARSTRLAALALGGPGRDLLLHRVTEAAFVAAPDAQVVVDAAGAVSVFNDRAERELGLARSDVGRPFVELPLATRPVDLRGAVASVQASAQTSHFRDVEWAQGDATHWDVILSPLVDAGDVLGVQLVFRDVSAEHSLRSELARTVDELSTAYEEVQSASEELETTNEELQSAVEELETTNEELQSINEELETMNEELQSTNEELQTVNDELRERTLEVDAANDFLHNVLEGLDTAVVVLDADYRVKMWNSGAEQLTGLRNFEAEGLQLMDLPLGLPLDELGRALRAVLGGEPRVTFAAEVTNRFGETKQRQAVITALPNGARGALLSLADGG